jgi:hypothetical protein
MRWRAQARFASIRSVSAFGGRRHGTDAVIEFPFFERSLPGRLLFSFRSVLWKTEARVNILFFLIAVFRKTG